MNFCIAFLHAGFFPALLAFLLWSLPGAIGMYLLSLGVSRVDPILPGPVYALLSGLNASTVGIIALAAVQLARKAITDPLTRMVVLVGACAGLCYNALWYFPTIMAIGGLVCVLWDHWMRGWVGRVRSKISRKREARADEEVDAVPMETLGSGSSVKSGASRRMAHVSIEQENGSNQEPAPTPIPANHYHKVPLKVGIAIIVGFFGTSMPR